VAPVSTGTAVRQGARGTGPDQGLGVLLPLGLVLLAAGLSFALWLRLVDEGRERLHGTVERGAAAVSAGLVAGERLRLEALQRMALRWQDGYLGGVTEWQRDAERYIADFPNLELLAIVERDGRYLGAVGRGPTVPDTRLDTDPTHAVLLQAAAGSGSAQFRAFPADASGRQRAAAVLPLRRDAADVGYLVAVVDATGFFTDALGGLMPAFGLTVIGADGVVLFVRPGEGGAAQDPRSRVTQRVPLRWLAVDLTVEAGATQEGYFTGGAAHLVLGLGLLCAVAAGVISLMWSCWPPTNACRNCSTTRW
jgi:hypothetical protein